MKANVGKWARHRHGRHGDRELISWNRTAGDLGQVVQTASACQNRGRGPKLIGVQPVHFSSKLGKLIHQALSTDSQHLVTQYWSGWTVAAFWSGSRYLHAGHQTRLTRCRIAEMSFSGSVSD